MTDLIDEYYTLDEAARLMRYPAEPVDRATARVRRLCLLSLLDWTRSTNRVNGRAIVLVSRLSVDRWLAGRRPKWVRPRAVARKAR